jgi:glycosyltransferase involved in cell wall biosynthesis
MKLLICTSEYFPHGSGIANVIYNIVGELKKQGVKCTICSPTGPDIILGNKKLIEKFGFLGLLYYWYQVSHFLKHTDYDVVWLQNPYFILHNPFPHCLITMHSTYFGLSHHNVGNTRFLRVYYKIISTIEEFSLAQLSKKTVFTGVGQPVCEELGNMGIEKERITYIPNGVDVQLFKPVPDKTVLRTKIGIPEDDIVILSVGQLSVVKQPETLIKIFSILENKLKNLTLCVAGKGELTDFSHNLVKKMGLRKIKFLGHIELKDLPALYTCADYYIITSKYEGLPLTLLEAMASGLPCIASDISQFSIVREANCGINIDFNNIEKAGTNIMNYLNGDHSDHGFNARDYAIKRLDWAVIAERYLDIFKVLLKS